MGDIFSVVILHYLQKKDTSLVNHYSYTSHMLTEGLVQNYCNLILYNKLQ